MLTAHYRQKSASEVNDQDNRWRRAWNRSKLVKELKDRLKDCYIFVIYMQLAYTQAQLIKSPHTLVKKTGRYPTVEVEWEGFTAISKMCQSGRPTLSKLTNAEKSWLSQRAR